MSQDKFNNLYGYIKSNNLTDLDEQTFLKEYSTNDDKFQNLYGYLKGNNLTDLDAETFKSEYFATDPEKKNQVGTSTKPPTQSGSVTQPQKASGLQVGEKKEKPKPSASSTSTQPSEIELWDKAFAEKKDKEKPRFRLPTEKELETKEYQDFLKKETAKDREGKFALETGASKAQALQNKIQELESEGAYPYAKFAERTGIYSPDSPMATAITNKDLILPNGKSERQFLEETFNIKGLSDVGVNMEDFEGFVISKGYGNKIIKRELDGSYDYQTRTYESQLAKELDALGAINSYISEKNSRYNQLIDLKKQAGSFYSVSETPSNFTLFNNEKYQEFIKNSFPTAYKTLKETEDKNKEKAKELMKRGGGLIDPVTGVDNLNEIFFSSAKSLFSGFADATSGVTATLLDKLGADTQADRIRIAQEQDKVLSANTYEYAYVEGKKVRVGDANYIVDSNGQVYSTDKGLNVTEILSPIEVESIQKLANNTKEKDWSVNGRGVAIQTSGVIGNMGLQVLLTSATGGTMSSAVAAQAFIGYSDTYEEIKRIGKEMGLGDAQIEYIANDAAMRSAAIMAATAPINPQLGSAKDLLGKTVSKQSVEKMIDAYKKKGLKGYLDEWVEVGKKTAKYASDFADKGTAELIQENIQELGSVEFVNKPTNSKLGVAVLNENINAQEFINTSMMSFISGGVLEARASSNFNHKRDFMTMVNNRGEFVKSLDILRETGKYSDKELSTLQKDVDNVAKHINKIPREVAGEMPIQTLVDISNKFDEVQNLEDSKKNIDKIFHPQIDSRIESARADIQEAMSSKVEGVSDKEFNKLKDEAANELIREHQSKGDGAFLITDKQITEKAIELYNQKQKQDEKSRQVSSKEGVSPTEEQVLSTELQEDGVQPQEEVEAKKADIERRRQEELKERAFNIQVNKTQYTLADGRIIEVTEYADGSYKTHALNDRGEIPVQISEGKDISEITKDYLEEVYGEGISEGMPIPIKTGQKDKINAKYDAELKALEQQTKKQKEITKPQEEVVEGVEQPTPNIALESVESTTKALDDKNDEVYKLNYDVEQFLPTSLVDSMPKGDTFQERLAPDYYENLKKNISENGIKEPLILRYYPKDNAIRLFEGHHRLKIAKELGIDEIPIQINVVWSKSINEGNDDIKSQKIYSPPKELDKESYRKRDYFPSNIKAEELGLINKNKLISEAYHKAKQDGTNPELVKAVEELLKPKTNAVQVETTGQVPVQPETTTSQEVEGGKPQAETEGVAKEEEVIDKKSIEEDLNASRERLKQAWNNYKTLGVVFDHKNQNEKDKELAKALVEFAYNKIRAGAYDVKTLIEDLAKDGIELSRDAAKYIFDRAGKKFNRDVSKNLGVKQDRSGEQSRIDKAFGIGIATQKIETEVIVNSNKAEGKKRSEIAKTLITEIKKRFQHPLNNKQITQLNKIIGDIANSKGNFDEVFNQSIDKINDIFNQSDRDNKLSRAISLLKQIPKNIKKAKLGDFVSKDLIPYYSTFVGFDPKTAFGLLSEKDFDLYLEVMERLGAKKEVLALPDRRAFQERINELANKYYNGVLSLNQTQADVDSVLQSLPDNPTKEDVNKAMKLIDGIIESSGMDKSLFDVPSKESLLEDKDKKQEEKERREAEREEQKQELKDIYKELSELALAEVEKQPIRNDTILNRVLDQITEMMQDKAFLDGLSLSQLEKLYNSLENINITGMGSKFLTDLSIGYQASQNAKDNFEIAENWKKSKQRLSLKVIDALERIRTAIFDLGYSKRALNGFVSEYQDAYNKMYQNPKRAWNTALGLKGSKDVASTTNADGLEQAQGVFQAMVRDAHEQISKLAMSLRKEIGVDINQSNYRVLFNMLYYRQHSNKLKKSFLSDDVNNVLSQFQNTADIKKRSADNKIKAEGQALQKFIDNYNENHKVEWDVEVNDDGSVTITVDPVKPMDIRVKTAGVDKVFRGLKAGDKITLDAFEANGFNDYLVVHDDNMLSKKEKSLVNAMRGHLDKISDFAQKTNAYFNGVYSVKEDNYFPMNAKSSSEKVIGGSLDDYITLGGNLSLRSGNLKELNKGAKELKLNPVSSFFTALNGVSLQYAKSYDLKLAANSVNGFLRVAIQNEDQTSINLAQAMTDTINTLVHADLAAASGGSNLLSRNIEDFLSNVFYSNALLNIQARTADFAGNVLDTMITQPTSVMNGVSLSKKLKSLSDGDPNKLATALINMKAGDFGGLAYSDMQSIAQANLTDRSLAKLDNKQYLGEAEQALDKLKYHATDNILFKGSAGLKSILMAYSDTSPKLPIFLDAFEKRFNELSDEDFDLERFVNGDRNYINRNANAINKASTYANNQASKVTSSGNVYALDARTAVQATRDIGVVKETTGDRRAGEVTTRKSILNYIADRSISLFAKFPRNNYSRMFNGIKKIANGEIREGAADVVSTNLKLALYEVAIVKSGILLKEYVLPKLLGYDDEDEELRSEIKTALDDTRKDHQLLSLLNKYFKLPKDATDEQKKEVLNEMYENKTFKNALNYIFVSQSMKEIANKIVIDVRAGNWEKSSKPIKDIVTIDELYNHIVYMVKNGEDTNEAMKKLSGFLFDSHAEIMDRPEKRVEFKKHHLSNVLAEILKDYRTDSEQVSRISLNKYLKNALRGNSTGSINTAFGNYIMAEASRVSNEMIFDRPYSFYADDIDLFNVRSMVDDNFVPDNASNTSGFLSYTFEALKAIEPKTFGTLSSMVKATERGDSDYAFTIPMALTLAPVVPGNPSVVRLEKDIRRDVIANIMNVTQSPIDIIEFGIEKELKEKVKEDKQAKERTGLKMKVGGKALEQLKEGDKRKFGGN